MICWWDLRRYMVRFGMLLSLHQHKLKCKQQYTNSEANAITFSHSCRWISFLHVNCAPELIINQQMWALINERKRKKHKHNFQERKKQIKEIVLWFCTKIVILLQSYGHQLSQKAPFREYSVLKSNILYQRNNAFNLRKKSLVCSENE